MGTMWFCPTLLIVSAISIYVLYVGNKYMKHPYIFTLLLMFLVVTCGEVAQKGLHLKSPYCIWQNLVISGILFEGWLFRKYLERYMPKKFIVSLLIGLGISLILVVVIRMGWNVRLQAAYVKEIPAVRLLGISWLSCIMIYAFSKIIINTTVGNVLAFLGNHSFSIMLLHFLSFKLVSLLICIYEGLNYSRISDFPIVSYDNIIWFFAYVVVGCVLPVMIVKMKNLILRKCY